jgi:xanthine dehydrogenase YagR molybdenum-binding subunit
MRTESMIGQPVNRVDGHLKVTGAARYTAEFPFENIAHAFVRLILLWQKLRLKC